MDYTYCAEFEHYEYPHIVHGSLRYVVEEDTPLDVLKKKIHSLLITQCRPNNLSAITQRSGDRIVVEHVTLSHVREASKWSDLETN